MAENANNDAAAAAAEKKGRAKKQKTEKPTKLKAPKSQQAVAEKVDEAPEAVTLPESSAEASSVGADVAVESAGSTSGDAGLTENGGTDTAVEAEDGNSEAVATPDDATEIAEDDARSEDTVESEVKPERKSTKKSATRAKRTEPRSRVTVDEDFQASVREQIENCQFAIVAALQESIHKEVNEMANRRIRQVERRRRISNLLHDIMILILAAVVGYFAYCLYDAKYFDFMQPLCEQEQNCDPSGQQPSEPKEEKVVKDTAWYIQNYGHLFTDLQVDLDASKVDAYYLYSDDYKVSEIQPSYLLGMAYNRLNLSSSYSDNNGNIVIPSGDMRTAFMDLFGSDDYYVRRNFVHGCMKFDYDKSVDSFVAPGQQCAKSQDREIIEEIDQIYEEGSVLYILTTATIYDKAETNFYNFDNLFKPAAQDVEKSDFDRYRSELNKYQYQFKKVNDKYYFSSVVKLK